MRKLPALIPISAMFFILVLLFIFMCLPPLSQTTANAVDGVLDLQGESLDGKTFVLGGEWHFYPDLLLDPSDFSKTLQTPAISASLGYLKNSCGTYHLVIKTDDTQPLMIYAPEILSAYTLWANGEKIGSAGLVSTRAKNEEMHIKNALLPVSPKDGVIDLCLQTSNFSFTLNGMHSQLVFGQTQSILSSFYLTRTLYCIALGCILMAAFYHLALYIFRRRERVYLIFSILCIMCFLRFAVETNGLNNYFQWIPMKIIGIRVYLVLLFLHSVTIMIFTLFIFNRKSLTSHTALVTAYVVMGNLLFIFMPLNSSLTLTMATLAITPFLLVVIIMAAKSPVLKENRWALLYFIALLSYFFVGVASKLFLHNVTFMTGLLTNIFIIMAQSLVLSKDYTKAFELVEDTNANLERIVYERTKDLQTTNNAMKELIGNISHDLKTPLSVMSVNLEKLGQMTQTLDDIDYQRHVSIAYHKNLDLQRLIQNLFEVSRIETGRSLYEPKWIDLRELFAQLQEKYGDFLESKGIELDISCTQSAEISIDPQKIWSVFDNIIYNAVRHMKNGGVIAITAEAEGKTVLVTVKDTGCGIAPEHLPHIFERFYKASSDRGQAAGDSGVGLYIVKSIMEGLGGKVSAKSEPDKGTSILLVFLRKLD